ncbi:hypothetical protein M758_1G138100 [Ceratodon purpureus]|nr:hypothetical protein M758_1G138100 [Ceratodon purpureus]
MWSFVATFFSSFLNAFLVGVLVCGVVLFSIFWVQGGFSSWWMGFFWGEWMVLYEEGYVLDNWLGMRWSHVSNEKDNN